MMASTELLEKLEGSVIPYINRDQEKQNISEKNIPVEQKELILSSAEKIQTISSEKDEIVCDGSCLKTPWWKFWITKVPCTCKQQYKLFVNFYYLNSIENLYLDFYNYNKTVSIL